MQILKKKNHVSHFFKKITPFLSIFLVGFLSFAIMFFVTRGTNPHTSELQFTEYSILGDKAGSVIPASCESSPFLVANGDGNYTGCATVTCWNNVVITPAMGESCPAQPAPTVNIKFQ